MPWQVLGALFATTVSLTGVLLADRGRYVHGFRTFDLNFLQAATIARAQQSKRMRQAHSKVAKVYLGRSQDFRRVSLYSSFYTAHMVLGTACMFLAFIFDFFIEGYYWVPFVILGAFFAVMSFMGWLIRYRIGFSASKAGLRKRVALWYENISWHLSTHFPPLLPPLTPRHLTRWPEVKALIDHEMKSYLQSHPDSKDLANHNILI